ncbi:MAG: aminoacyl-tRNA hydrolase, partial [Clostridia bacterium]
MFVVVGLGNPGSKYTHTRHNVGFDVTQILAEKMGIMINRAKCHALVGEGVYQGERMVLAQPQTFMNDS